MNDHHSTHHNNDEPLSVTFVDINTLNVKKFNQSANQKPIIITSIITFAICFILFVVPIINIKNNYYNYQQLKEIEETKENHHLIHSLHLESFIRTSTNTSSSSSNNSGSSTNNGKNLDVMSSRFDLFGKKHDQQLKSQSSSGAGPASTSALASALGDVNRVTSNSTLLAKYVESKSRDTTDSTLPSLPLSTQADVLLSDPPFSSLLSAYVAQKTTFPSQQQQSLTLSKVKSSSILSQLRQRDKEKSSAPDSISDSSNNTSSLLSLSLSPFSVLLHLPSSDRFDFSSLFFPPRAPSQISSSALLSTSNTKSISTATTVRTTANWLNHGGSDVTSSLIYINGLSYHVGEGVWKVWGIDTLSDPLWLDLSDHWYTYQHLDDKKLPTHAVLNRLIKPMSGSANFASLCTDYQEGITFFLSPHWPSNVFHLHNDHILPFFAVLREMKIIKSTLNIHYNDNSSNNNSLYLSPSSQVNLYYFPTSQGRDSLTSGHSLLYSFYSSLSVQPKIWNHLERQTPKSSITGDISGYEGDDNDVICFKKVVWGKGTTWFYDTSSTFQFGWSTPILPFPLPHPFIEILDERRKRSSEWSEILSTWNKHGANKHAKDLYQTWMKSRTFATVEGPIMHAGVPIDYHNYILSHLNISIRVRPNRQFSPPTHITLTEAMIRFPNSTNSYPLSSFVNSINNQSIIKQFVNNPIRVIYIARSIDHRTLALESREIFLSKLEEAMKDVNPYSSESSSSSSQSSSVVPLIDLVICCDWSSPVSSLLKLFQSGDILIGEHGAGLSNLIYLSPGGLVIEFITHHNDMYGYESIFASMSEWIDHDYIPIDLRDEIRRDEGYKLEPEKIKNISEIVIEIIKKWKLKQIQQINHLEQLDRESSISLSTAPSTLSLIPTLESRSELESKSKSKSHSNPTPVPPLSNATSKVNISSSVDISSQLESLPLFSLHPYGLHMSNRISVQRQRYAELMVKLSEMEGERNRRRKIKKEKEKEKLEKEKEMDKEKNRQEKD